MKSFRFLLLITVWLLVKNDILAPFRAQWKKSIQVRELMEHIKCTADFVPFVAFLPGFSRSVLPSAAPWLCHFCSHLVTDTNRWNLSAGTACVQRMLGQSAAPHWFCSVRCSREVGKPLSQELSSPGVPLTTVKNCSSVCHPSPWRLCPRWTFQASNLFVFLTVCGKWWVRLFKAFNRQKLEEGGPFGLFTGHRPIPRVTSLPLFCYLLKSISTGFEHRV